MWRKALLAAGAFLLIGASAFQPGTAGAQQVNPSDFSPLITNPLFPISSYSVKVFEGREEDDDGSVTQRLESRTLTTTEKVGAITVTVLRETEWIDGELVEVAHDYFAQHRNGDVHYFGETVDNYVDGRLRNHNGAWLAFEGRNEPGIIMLANPTVGKTYKQEYAPGEAEDVGTIVALNESVRVPAGSFTGCVKIKDTTPLEPDLVEYKWFCPGIGMVREESEDSYSELVSFTRSGPVATPITQPGGVAAPNTVAAALPLPAQPNQPQQPAAAPSTAANPARVAPPSTGDAGLAAGREQGTATSRAVLVSAVVVGSGALLLLRRRRYAS